MRNTTSGARMVSKVLDGRSVIERDGLVRV